MYDAVWSKPSPRPSAGSRGSAGNESRRRPDRQRHPRPSVRRYGKPRRIPHRSPGRKPQGPARCPRCSRGSPGIRYSRIWGRIHSRRSHSISPSQPCRNQSAGIECGDDQTCWMAAATIARVMWWLSMIAFSFGWPSTGGRRGGSAWRENRSASFSATRVYVSPQGVQGLPSGRHGAARRAYGRTIWKRSS